MHIKIENLSHRFDDKLVLNNICLDSNFTSLAVIGPSGGGKSTLLRVLGGLITPVQGSFSFNGVKILYASDPSLHKKIGFVFQNNGLFPHLSGLDNITLPLIHVGGLAKNEAEDIAQSLLERFSLSEHSKKLPYALSGGQQQRIAIARAVASKPDILLLDEPTSALDPEFTSEVLDMIHELQEEGLSIILATHEMGFARNACQNALFLAGGNLLEYGPSKTFFVAPQTEELQFFLHKILEWK